MLLKFAMVAMGGSLGAMARFAIAIYYAGPSAGQSFPTSTFTANVLGCFLAGLSYVLITQSSWMPQGAKELVLIGFFGALTTFSTFSVEAMLMVQQGHGQMALIYVVASLIFCLVAAWAGLFLSRALFF